MTITKTADVDGTLAADLRAGTPPAPTSCAARATSSRRPRASPASCPARRCRSSPTSTTSTRWRSPRSRPACTACGSTPATSASPSTSSSSPQEAKDRGVPIRIGVNGGSLDPTLYEKYGGRVTPEAMVESAQIELGLLRRGRLRRREDLGEGVERAADDRGLPPAVRGHRPPAAPRRHRGRPAARPGWSRRRPASPRCSPRASATRSATRSPPTRSRRRGPGRQLLEAHGPAGAQERRPHRLPELRPRRDRRHRGRQAGAGRVRRPRDPVAGRGDGLRRQRPGRGTRRRPRHRRRPTARPPVRQGHATSRSSPRTRWSPRSSSGPSSSTSTASRPRIATADTTKARRGEAEQDRAALLDEQGDDANASEQKVELIHKRVDS